MVRLFTSENNTLHLNSLRSKLKSIIGQFTLPTLGDVLKATLLTCPVASNAFCCCSVKGINLRGRLARKVGNLFQLIDCRPTKGKVKFQTALKIFRKSVRLFSNAFFSLFRPNTLPA